MEDVEAEGVDQSNRVARGYTDEPADYDVSEAASAEKADDEVTKVKSPFPKDADDAQAAANKAKAKAEIDAEMSAFEKDAQSLANQEPTKFVFKKQGGSDFTLGRTAANTLPFAKQAHELDEALPTQDPRLKPQPAQASAALHTRDKSQMQGVGPRPTLSDPKRDPFKPLGEAAPANEKAEDFIKKNKESYKKRYGARWEEVLYATANKKFGDK